MRAPLLSVISLLLTYATRVAGGSNYSCNAPWLYTRPAKRKIQLNCDLQLNGLNP